MPSEVGKEQLEKFSKFLAALEGGSTVAEACVSAGLSLGTVQKIRKVFPDLNLKVKAAIKANKHKGGPYSLGRPSLLTPEREELILTEVRAGMPLTIVAGLAEVSPDAIRSWVREGGDQYNADFALKFYKAKAGKAKEAIEAAVKMWKGNPQSIFWWIKHNVEEYREKVDVDVTSKGEQIGNVTFYLPENGRDGSSAESQ